VSHRHEWTLLYESGLRWYGTQDSHRHACFDEKCGAYLIEDRRDCSGKFSNHRISK